MTNGEIDRLGQRIASSSEVLNRDIEQLQAFRQSFQEPISRVFSFVLHTARKLDRQSIVTYRIKRIDTIIEKLQRFHNNPKGEMNLSRMWDIAGCRCIMNSPDNKMLYRLQQEIINEFGNESKVNDHISIPSDSGYRSIHIYVKDRESNKRVEIQIRNVEQHNWATLVEIVDLLYGTKQKERGAIGVLGRFLYLYSKANDLSGEEFLEMMKIEKKRKVFELMSDVLTKNYLNIRRQWIAQKHRGNYYVIAANNKQSEIVSYPSFKEAEEAYYEKYLTNRDANIVLTHIKQPDFDQISTAYSNYVLAVHAFFDDYRVIVARKILECVRDGQYRQFFRLFNIYNRNVKSHFHNLSLEVKSLTACQADPTISRNQINKWIKEIKSRLSLWFRETRDFLNKLGLITRGNKFRRWLVKNRVRSLAKAVSEGQRIVTT